MNQCVQDPASCLPEVPDPEPCLANPAGCLPGTPDVSDPGRCVQDPNGCLGGEDPDADQPLPEEDEERGAAPVKGSKPSRGRGGGSAAGPPRASSVTGIATRTGDEERVADLLSSAGPQPDRGLGGLGSGLADATRRFAFPIGVAALVGAFLLIQGRVDRKDPKLAAAPIDSRDDLVIYR